MASVNQSLEELSSEKEEEIQKHEYRQHQMVSVVSFESFQFFWIRENISTQYQANMALEKTCLRENESL